MEDRLKILAQWLQNVETSDFGYNSYHDGRLENAIAESQVETCNKIGSFPVTILRL